MAHPHASPQGILPPHAMMNGHGGPIPNGPPEIDVVRHITTMNEEAWMRIGSISELMNNGNDAISAYENALRHNRYSVHAMLAIANILRGRDQFAPAIDYLRAITKFEERNGDVWASLGHCYLMLDNLQDAYQAYQQALYHLPDLREPRLWYGIGILYDRYGSLEHAEEAFSQVMRMSPEFEKANEIYFRLGIIYKQQTKYKASLDCFRYIVMDPPKPLTREDIWFQIGHVHEQQKDYDSAKSAYMRVLECEPKHAKVLQQLGWLYHQQSNDYQSQEQAIEYLEKSVSSDQQDAQSWYLLGRCYMQQQKYPRAYEAYQQAVYRDGRNPTFWCSIGVLYYQINQYRDALDAYSRAIRLNPNISEVWYDLGTLYESCNNQTADALDAYQRAAELDPQNGHIKARLNLLREGHTSNGMSHNSGPLPPRDVPPQAYQPQMNGPNPNWQGSGPPQQIQGPPPQLDYSARLADIQSNPPQGPQQLQSYDSRDGLPRQHLQGPPRMQSPRQEPSRQHQELPRGPPLGPPRRLSPSPKTRHAAPQYAIHGHGPPPQHMHEQPGSSHGPPQPNRISNPNYAPHGPAPGPPPMSAPPVNGPPPPPLMGQLPMGGYGRHSPQNEPRHIVDTRPPSTGINMHPQHYPPARPGSSLPPPPSIQHGPAPHGTPLPQHMGHPDVPREREDVSRNAMPPKRHREWEEEARGPQTAPNDEKRPRLEEHMPPRLPSTHERPPSQPNHAHMEELRRAEEHRRINDGYHPSEAAHHPPALGPVSGSAPPQPRVSTPQNEAPIHSFTSQNGPRPKESPPHEPPARKMEVDEDYDDDGDDEKRVPASTTSSRRESPRMERGQASDPKAETKQEA